VNEAVRIDLDTTAPSWCSLVAAAEGAPDAESGLSTVRHPVIDAALTQSSIEKQKDACWAALMEARLAGGRDATNVIGALLANDPDRTLPKIAVHRPVAVVVADKGERFDPWPRDDNGMRRKGRLIWFLDSDGEIGQVSWLKVVERAAPSHGERVARVARLIVHDQVHAARENWTTADCPCCGAPMSGETHVDHVQPFADLLDEWVSGNGGYESVAAEITNPPDGDPTLPDGLANSWSAFHAARAELAMTHATCNLRKGRKSG
jgi:hypothetical protein